MKDFPEHSDIELGDDLDDWGWVSTAIAWIVIGIGCLAFGAFLGVCLIRGCISQ